MGFKSLSTKLILLIITILISLTFIEMSLIFYEEISIKKNQDDIFKKFLKFSELYGWENEPNIKKNLTIPDGVSLVETNSNGFRDYEHNITKNKNRIVIIGDSFTWGLGVNNEETYSKLLETYPKNLETINMGVPGYGTDQEYLTIINKGLKYDPDTVVLMYQVSTDLGDTNTNVNNGRNKPFFKMIDNNLVLTNYPIKVYENNSKNPSFLKKLKVYELVRDNIISIPIIRDTLIEKFHIGRHYDFKKDYDLVFKIFLDLNEKLKSKNIKFIVIIMPDRGQLKGIISNRSIEYMEEFFNQNDIDYINMYNYFNKGNFNEFYFKIDGHINRKGHEEVAKAIYEKLS